MRESMNYIENKSRRINKEEAKEQQVLRQEYIEAIRRNLRGQLNNISIQNPDGTVTDLGKKHGNKNKLTS